MKVRIKFSKYGVMKFIGHLDLMRFFQKAVRRAGIDIAYSGGFNPHQIMSFASPLGVGIISNAEYLDIGLNEDVADINEIKYRLSAQMVEGIRIIAVAKLEENAANAMASVAVAGYTVIFSDKVVLPIDWTGQFEAFLQKETIIYTKRTKKVVREIDLRPLIYEAEIYAKAEMCAENRGIYLLINAGSAESIKPQFVIEAFFDYIGQQLPEFALSICREEIYTNAGTAEEPRFVALIG
ncbi:MAG: TIGR03936 family radical SAM-associated protein [Lachnospiraceae bacterium]|nr:TIGR03936 family radical SAM-associated protein [Lachnospiraceae bacterium]